MNETELQRLVMISCRDLQIDAPVLINLTDIEALKLWLAKEVDQLLHRDFQKLVNLLYRIDVGEDRAKAAFASADSENLSMKLAELIIARELQKVETRRKYRSQ